MQIKKLRELFDRYRKFLSGPEADTRLPYWETQKVFQENWDLQSEALPEMIDRSLQNQATRRVWKRDHWEPKRMLLELARLEPDYLRQAFKDLFDENKSVEGRATRFLFYADELMEMYRKANPRKIDTGHYLEDYEFIFLLLALRFPYRYAPYPAAAFQKLLVSTLAPSPPLSHDLERFAKICRTLYGLLEKEGLVALSAERLDRRHYGDTSMLIVFDFLLAVAG